MKKITLLFVLFICISAFTASAQDIFTAWPALGNFHGVLSATFHTAEKGNFDPVKQRSGEMADKAVLLSKSAVPATYKKPGVDAAIADLNDRTTDLNELIMKHAKDVKINKALVQVHDAFHKIVSLSGGEDRK